MRRLLLSAVLGLGGAVLMAPVPVAAQPPNVPPAMIFVANDSGDDTHLTENMTDVISRACLPFRVRTVRWTSYLGPRLDENDVELHRKTGACMAAQAALFRKQCPGVRVCLMGYGAGAHVVLAAAEMSAPHSIDRVVVLAPSVSCTYDLRQAIKGTQTGIDVYFSCWDGLLDSTTQSIGTADGRRRVPAAGQIGFQKLPPGIPDANLYCLVRQYPWRPGLYEGTCNGGCHCGPVQYNFLRLVVIPAMISLPH